MRVLVCGGRDFSDTVRVYRALDELKRHNVIDAVIEGDARGADRIAGYWARKNRIDNIKFPADWDKDGRAAGPIRNERMLREGKPNLVLAFPGGKGTANMKRLAEQAGVPVVEG
jgi:hypothetical protein